MEIPDSEITKAIGNAITSKLGNINLKAILDDNIKRYIESRSASPPMIEAIDFECQKSYGRGDFTELASDEDFFKNLGIPYEMGARNKSSGASSGVVRFYFNNPVNPMPLIGFLKEKSSKPTCSTSIIFRKDDGLRTIYLSGFLTMDETDKTKVGEYNQIRDYFVNFISTEKNKDNLAGVSSNPRKFTLVEKLK